MAEESCMLPRIPGGPPTKKIYYTKLRCAADIAAASRPAGRTSSDRTDHVIFGVQHVIGPPAPRAP